jgi:hypothetical protein
MYYFLFYSFFFESSLLYSIYLSPPLPVVRGFSLSLNICFVCLFISLSLCLLISFVSLEPNMKVFILLFVLLFFRLSLNAVQVVLVIFIRFVLTRQESFVCLFFYVEFFIGFFISFSLKFRIAHGPQLAIACLQKTLRL